MNVSSTCLLHKILFFLFSTIFCLPAQAITAFQNQITFTYDEEESLGSAANTKLLNAGFLHHHQLVNPFAGPVDEAAFLNRIGSTGADFNYIQLATDIAGTDIEPNGIGYQFQYSHVTPNKPLTAALQIGKQTIEDDITGGAVLLEGTIKSTTLSVGAYINEFSHINLTSFSDKLDFSTNGVSIADIETSSLQIRYKRVWVNPGKKSFNFEASYLKGNQQVNGTTQSSDFTTVKIMTDVYFSSQSKMGLGLANNSDKITGASDSRTVILRGSSYFDGTNAVGFSYFNTRFDASINNEKSFSIFYRMLLM